MSNHWTIHHHSLSWQVKRQKRCHIHAVEAFVSLVIPMQKKDSSAHLTQRFILVHTPMKMHDMHRKHLHRNTSGLHSSAMSPSPLREGWHLLQNTFLPSTDLSLPTMRRYVIKICFVYIYPGDKSTSWEHAKPFSYLTNLCCSSSRKQAFAAAKEPQQLSRCQHIQRWFGLRSSIEKDFIYFETHLPCKNYCQYVASSSEDSFFYQSSSTPSGDRV